MDVYLIPVAPDRYEMYCEAPADVDTLVGDVQPTGRFAALMHKFRVAIAHAEKEQERCELEPQGAEPQSWMARMQARGMRWITEKIAEQRLLWRIRNESDARLFFPPDITASEALLISRAELEREANRHLKWTIIDGLIFLATGAVALVPGPNVLAYYFGFRLVGHFLSRRGAVRGLNGVTWTACGCEQLLRLRNAIALGGHEREREVREVASALQLPQLAKFFQRTSARTA